MDSPDYEYTASVEPPLVTQDPSTLAWSYQADIVVVGFGGAGAVAALQAREDGASVIVLDRFGGGGATANSGGVIYAGGTRFQREAGFEDSAEEMYRYLDFEGTPVREETLRRFCETSNDNVEWLGGHGVRFGSTFYSDKAAYPPDGYFLYFSGMENMRGDKARPIPRGHRTMGKGPTGRFYFAPLREAAARNGVQQLLHAPVRRLVTDATGTVIGVEFQQIPPAHWKRHEALYRKVNSYIPMNGSTAEKAIAECRVFEAGLPRQRTLVRAHRGVILASGGYNYNLRLFSRYRPEVTSAYGVLCRGGTMGCDGSGIELGISVGGATDYMDRVFLTKPLSPPPAFTHGVLVNREGRRFSAEDAYVGNLGDAVSRQSNGGEAWLILDSRTLRDGVRQLMQPLKNLFSWYGMPAALNLLFGGTKRARTLAELARKRGIDATVLEQTVRSYNAAAATGEDAAFGKLRQHLTAMDQPPYYAVNMSLRNKFGFSGTMPYGGLTVDEASGAVTRADGSVVRGLFAAGRTAVGVCSKSNFSGLSIADTVFSGRRAARAAACGRSERRIE